MLVAFRLLALQEQASGLLHCRQGCSTTVIGSSPILTIPSELVNFVLAFEVKVLNTSLSLCLQNASVSLSMHLVVI